MRFTVTLLLVQFGFYSYLAAAAGATAAVWVLCTQTLESDDVRGSGLPPLQSIMKLQAHSFTQAHCSINVCSTAAVAVAAAAVHPTQEADDIRASRSRGLPPLQSIMELTSAHLPPTRQSAVQQTGAAALHTVQGSTPAGRALEDGAGMLQDGTK